MRLRLDCIPCYLRQALRALRFSGLEHMGGEVLREVMRRLIELDWTLTPMEIGFEVYRVVREVTGVRDLYAEVKRRSNRLVLDMLPGLRERVRSSEDPLRTAVLLSIAGNIIDYGALDTFNVEEAIERCLKARPAIDDYPLLRERLEEAEAILYFTDNAGEVVFDRLLAETLVEELGARRITFIVKNTPIINDTTIVDAVEVGLHKVPGAEVRELACSSLEEYLEFKETLEEWISRADVVISKGQGNYELLSEVGKAFFLLVAKCPVIAGDLGVDVGDTVIAQGPR